MRLSEPTDPAQEPARRKIHDTQAVVAELGDEQTFAGEVDREMIDPAADLAQGNLALQHERLSRAGSGGPRESNSPTRIKVAASSPQRRGEGAAKIPSERVRVLVGIAATFTAM